MSKNTKIVKLAGTDNFVNYYCIRTDDDDCEFLSDEVIIRSTDGWVNASLYCYIHDISLDKFCDYINLDINESRFFQYNESNYSTFSGIYMIPSLFQCLQEFSKLDYETFCNELADETVEKDDFNKENILWYAHPNQAYLLKTFVLDGISYNIIIRSNDGWINATKLCEQFKNKCVSEFCHKYNLYKNDSKFFKRVIVAPHNIQGKYIHPIFIIRLIDYLEDRI